LNHKRFSIVKERTGDSGLAVSLRKG